MDYLGRLDSVADEEDTPREYDEPEDVKELFNKIYMGTWPDDVWEEE